MPSSTTHSQSTISSYFQSSPQKRSNPYIDLTLENDDSDVSTKSPPSKRFRLTRTTNDSPTRKSPLPLKVTTTTAAATADDWRFSPEKARAGGCHRQLSAAEKERQEAFKRKLLLDNSRFLRKEAEEVVDEVVVDHGDGGDELCEENDGRFEKLSEMFAHKSQVKANDKKGKSFTVRSKKVVELGSSGEPYTPLEKQVCALTFPF
jgi:DNA mismatch repair protein MSH3